ncbi:MAG: undecaprenyl diphosphate synthase family protein [Candidatus Saccharimonadales bacterium]
MEKPTFHVAIIPDGNRRWAKQHGIGAYSRMYKKGVDRTLEISEAAFAAGVTHLSLWGSSYANIADRTGDFSSSIDKLYRTSVHKFADHPLISKYDVRIQAIGEWRDTLTKPTIDAINKVVDQTNMRGTNILTLLFSYSGSRERAAAIQSLLKSDVITPHGVEASNMLLREHSWTSSLPQVDLIVRTGAWHDPHNSAGFLSLLADETQLVFPEVLWPDFTSEHMTKIIDEFRARERRFGK